jgi:hypothetical protein
MDIQTLISQKISTFQHGYYLWIILYGVLGLGSIIGPGLAATPLLREPRSRVAAGIGALCAAVFGFLQPNTYATAFDVALRIVRDAQITYSTGQAKPEDIAARLIDAENLTHFSYSGLQDVAASKTRDGH